MITCTPSRGRAAAMPLLLATLVAGACGPGTLPSAAPASPSARAAPATATAAPSAAPATGETGPAPGAALPPAAVLEGPAGERVGGDLGTFTWDGLVSDSPWIVGAASIAVPAGAPLRLELAAGPSVRAWQARVAPLRAGAAGDAVLLAAGAGPRIAFAAPGPGAWSVAVRLDHGEAGNATWYWRLEAAP